MNPPWVFDRTAIQALFASDPAVYGMLELAEAGQRQILLPATAIADASHFAGITDGAWEAVLLTRGVAVHALDQSTAIASAGLPGDVCVRQAVWEALHVGGIVVTAAASQYPAGSVPLRIID